MTKTHILFFDGTQNYPFKPLDSTCPLNRAWIREKSNVELLCQAAGFGDRFECGCLCEVKEISTYTGQGLAYYLPGVGSPWGPQDSDLLDDKPFDRERLPPEVVQRNANAAAVNGSGAHEQIMHAYLAVAKNYSTEDSLVVVGFSRGACVARSFCGLLNRCGVQSRKPDETDKTFARRIHKEYKSGEQTGQAVEVQACVCFDSVKGDFLGIKETLTNLGQNAPCEGLDALKGPLDDRHHDFNPPNIHRFRHNLSMDENRRTFAYMPWKDNGKTLAESIWFPGVHSDVGGGYADAPLSVFPVLSAAAFLDKEANIRFDERILVSNQGDSNAGPLFDGAKLRNSRHDMIQDETGLAAPFLLLVAKIMELMRFGLRRPPTGDKVHFSATYRLVQEVEWATRVPEFAKPFRKLTRAFSSSRRAAEHALAHNFDDSSDISNLLSYSTTGNTSLALECMTEKVNKCLQNGLATPEKVKAEAIVMKQRKEEMRQWVIAYHKSPKNRPPERHPQSVAPAAHSSTLNAPSGITHPIPPTTTSSTRT